MQRLRSLMVFSALLSISSIAVAQQPQGSPTSPAPAQQPAVQQANPQSGAPAAAAQPSAATSESLAKAELEGQMAGENVGTGGWFGGGLVAGVLTGLIGTGVTWALAANSNVEVPPDKRLEIANRSSLEQATYERAYQKKVKSRRVSSAIGGGLVGTAAFVVLYMAAGSGN